MPDTSPSAGSNGHSTAAETIYALSDEQILDINEDADLGDASVTPSEVSLRSNGTSVSTSADPSAATSRPAESLRNDSTESAPPDSTTQASADNGAGEAPPEWLAQAMADPQRGGEARTFWESAQTAQRDSAAYRATFPTPDAARDAAGRAEQLGSLDRAYFGATGVAPQQLSASREALAQQLLREDPAAFCDMLAAGLRAVGVKNVEGIVSSLSGVSSSPAAGASTSLSLNSDSRGTNSPGADPHGNTASIARAQQSASQNDHDARATHDARLAEYAAFERATNDELEHAVRPEIARVLERALPATRANDAGRATHARLAGMVRNEVEAALKQDRALGEQVAQLLRGGALPGQHGAHARASGPPDRRARRFARSLSLTPRPRRVDAVRPERASRTQLAPKRRGVSRQSFALILSLSFFLPQFQAGSSIRNRARAAFFFHLCTQRLARKHITPRHQLPRPHRRRHLKFVSFLQHCLSAFTFNLTLKEPSQCPHKPIPTSSPCSSKRCATKYLCSTNTTTFSSP